MSANDQQRAAAAPSARASACGARDRDGDARAAAREAGLRFSTDAKPGWTRRRAGRGFSYRDVEGRPIRDPAALRRIRALAIPPAWTEVWICPIAEGHMQATGRDARGRKQYRYHPGWIAHRREDRFARMIGFGRALPRIRRRCDRDLARRGASRDKVVAAVVRLLELTLIRVGNAEYARLYRSFGLTTLRGRHVRVDGAQIRFRFPAKSGQIHDVDLRDRRLAAVIRRCQELPGQELFAYVDTDGTIHDVASDDVNAYLREAAGDEFTAKDFRTWAGTVLAYRALRDGRPGESTSALRRDVAEAVRQAAERLRNTPAVARSTYVAPAVVDAYLDGDLGSALVEDATARGHPPPDQVDPPEERALIRLLEARRTTRRTARLRTVTRPRREAD
jgi:DNA topoisomerase-1